MSFMMPVLRRSSTLGRLSSEWSRSSESLVAEGQGPVSWARLRGGVEATASFEAAVAVIWEQEEQPEPPERPGRLVGAVLS